jgi:GWxTD domain-containing protein
MRIMHLLPILSVLAIATGTAQPPRPADAQIPMFLEPVVIPSADSSQWQAILNYRIDRDFFIPIRNGDTTIAGQFRRMGDILIELTDSVGGPVARRIVRVDLSDATLQPPGTEPHWVQGTASFIIPPGTHRVFFEVTDAESQRRQVNKDVAIRVPRYNPDSTVVSGAMLCLPPEPASPDTLVAENLGGNLLFGKNRSLLLTLYSGKDPGPTASCTWTFRVWTYNKEKDRVHARDSLVQVPIIRDKRVEMLSSDTDVRAVLTADTTRSRFLIVLPLPTAMLPLRDYTFTLDVTTASGQHCSYSRPLRAIWPDMPFSMKDVEGALDALRFIVTPAKLDSLRSGSFEEQRDALERFWQTRYPTSGSARNERMTEYYRRVDYAIRNFGTIRVPDGSRSDRGKIFIIFGPATRTDRALNPAGANVETWIYEALKKRFVFVDEGKNGTYTLEANASR